MWKRCFWRDFLYDLLTRETGRAQPSLGILEGVAGLRSCQTCRPWPTRASAATAVARNFADATSSSDSMASLLR